MRTKNSLINIAISMLSYGIITVGTFFTRKIFTEVLGLEIVAIDSNFSKVVAALAIVELGLGVGIVYKLYKPILNKDWDKVAVILCFLRKCYVIIAAAVLGLGLCSAYFVTNFIRCHFSKIWLMSMFILYVLDTLASYLYAHKRAMFVADQKNYANNIIHTIMQIVLFISQFIVLKTTGSLEWFLIYKIISRVCENVIISCRFNKRYKFINLKIKSGMSAVEKKDLFKNMNALLLHKIASFGTTTVSSLIVLDSFGMKCSGKYGNYDMVIMGISTITSEIFNGIIASFGNLLSASTRKKVYENFSILYFVNYLMYSYIISSFICLITPFVSCWTGKDSTLGIITATFMAAYLYVYGMRQSIVMVKTSAGIYNQDKYMVLFGFFITFVSSFVLVKPFGIPGVMIGNIIGIMLVPYWVQPYLVYEEIFKVKVSAYHLKFVLYTVLTGLYSFVCYQVCGKIRDMGIDYSLSHKISSTINSTPDKCIFVSEMIINFIVCLIIPNVMNLIIFCKTKEFKELYSYVKYFVKKKKSK